MKAYTDSVLNTYLVIPDDEQDNRTSYFVNWPMDLTDDEELPILNKYNLRSLGWSWADSQSSGLF